MTAIEPGDRVRLVCEKTQHDVWAVHDDWAWISGNGDTGHLRRLEYLAKVEPVFEIGKTYRHRRRGCVVTVVGVQAEYAVGWESTCGRRADTLVPEPVWWSRHDQRPSYDEVGS